MSKEKYVCRGQRVRIGEWVPCGESLDAVIAAVPEDGKVHVVECPSCGSQRRVCKLPLSE